MGHLLNRLLALSRVARSRSDARRECAVFALRLDGRRALPGSLQRLSPAGDFSQPMISPCGKRVAYWGIGAGEVSAGIWVSGLPGDCQARRLTTAAGTQGHPFWHPDGVRLVHFASDATYWDRRRQFSPDRTPTRLCWLDSSTGESYPLTDGRYVDERPAVAPDGRTVVFVSNRSGRLNLWRIDEHGQQVEQLTDGPGPDYRPCISPDGQRLAYFSSGPDGSHQVRLRMLETGEELNSDWTRCFDWSHGPFWCPDGETLLVHAQARGTSAPALWLVAPRTGEFVKLDTPGLPTASHGTMDLAARWLVCDSRAQPEPRP